MANKTPALSGICKEISENCVAINLRKLTRLATNAANEKLKPAGLRTTQLCVLAAIGGNPGQTLTGYAEELCMDLSTLTRSLDTLASKNWVYLKPGQRREKRAYLTETGTQKIIEAYPIWQRAQSEFIKTYGEVSWPKDYAAIKAATK